MSTLKSNFIKLGIVLAMVVVLLITMTLTLAKSYKEETPASVLPLQYTEFRAQDSSNSISMDVRDVSGKKS